MYKVTFYDCSGERMSENFYVSVADIEEQIDSILDRYPGATVQIQEV